MFDLSGNSRLETMGQLGFHPKIGERPTDKWAAIEMARKVFASCDWDEAACAQGIRRMGNYRKEWDDMRGTWRNKPFHDDNSNAADAFMTFSAGWSPPDRHNWGEITMPNRIGTIA